MVEMLMTAVILAIGILGLTALQAMTLTTNARSKGYNAAVEVAGHILENIESQARQSWLIKSDDPAATIPTYAPAYFAGASVNENFTFNGHYPDLAAVNPIDQVGFFTTTTSSVGVQSVNRSGALTTFTVQVQFTEAGPSGVSVPRTVTISRTVLHGHD